MTVISSNISLNHLLLTYLKARWFAPTARTAPARDGFLGWLADRGDSLDDARYEHFTRYRVRDAAADASAFATFALRNLPLDTEPVAEYVIRFVDDQARIGYVVGDAAYHRLVTRLTIVTSDTALATFQTWWSTGPMTDAAPLADKLAAFRAHLVAGNRVPTGETIGAIAAAESFDACGWVGQRMAMVDPTDVMAWLHMPMPEAGRPDPSMPDPVAAIEEPGRQLTAKNDLIAVKRVMHAHGMALFGTGYDPGWAADLDREALVRILNKRVYAAILALNGFAAPTGATYVPERTTGTARCR